MRRRGRSRRHLLAQIGSPASNNGKTPQELRHILLEIFEAYRCTSEFFSFCLTSQLPVSINSCIMLLSSMDRFPFCVVSPEKTWKTVSIIRVAAKDTGPYTAFVMFHFIAADCLGISLWCVLLANAAKEAWLLAVICIRLGGYLFVFNDIVPYGGIGFFKTSLVFLAD